MQWPLTKVARSRVVSLPRVDDPRARPGRSVDWRKLAVWLATIILPWTALMLIVVLLAGAAAPCPSPRCGDDHLARTEMPQILLP